LFVQLRKNRLRKRRRKRRRRRRKGRQRRTRRRNTDIGSACLHAGHTVIMRKRMPMG